MPSPLDALPEVFISNTATSVMVSRALAEGLLRQLGPKLYTKNLTEEPNRLVRRNVWQIVAAYEPGALIADRTAIENAPARDGSVFIVSHRKRDIELPGLKIRPRKGTAPTPEDLPFIGGLRLSSTARAYLDNMAPSRRRSSDVSRTLSRADLEVRLDEMIRRGGDQAANKLRDDARRIAPLIERDEEFAELDKLIGALLGTREHKLATNQARARGAGTPFDPARLALFEQLHAELRATALPHRPARARGDEGEATRNFFEAYFSNFIEGTEFEVSEAADIVFRSVIPRDRPEDAHDILGTWRIVADPIEMARTPRTAEELLGRLKARHAILMGGRPDKSPGSFKQAPNRAGQTIFVAPDDVEGTLSRGFELTASLEAPLARAIYMMFLVSEVHPFADGNGRLARVMMNAELAAAGEERILIPTIFRSNYLSTLKALSLNQHTRPLIRTLDFAQKWTAAIPWAELTTTEAVLDQCNAFMDPVEADDAGMRLRLPEV